MPVRLLAMTACLAALLAGAGAAWSAERLPVSASFSILADLVAQVGGDRVAVRPLVGPGADAHGFQPAPADAKAVADAKIFVVNGLGFDAWSRRLERAAGFKGLTIVASETVRGLPASDTHRGSGGHAHGADEGLDPHAWQSVANVRVYVTNIRDGLAKADSDGRAAYEGNAARYLAELDALDREVKEAAAAIPPERRKVITSHEAFGYFARAYGFTFLAPQGVSTEAEASAKGVARLIRQIKAEKVPAVFVENLTDRRLLEQIGRETGARMGGVLFSDALSGADGPAPSYLAMMRHNMRVLAAALQP